MSTCKNLLLKMFYIGTILSPFNVETSFLNKFLCFSAFSIYYFGELLYTFVYLVCIKQILNFETFTVKIFVVKKMTGNLKVDFFTDI